MASGKPGAVQGEIAMIAGGLIVGAVLAVLGAWYLVDYCAPKDPNDPLTKARDLKPEQTIQAK